jgi:hypothetical protein
MTSRCTVAVGDNDEECGMPLPCPDHPRTIEDVYAEWDDPDAFRVFLMYSDNTTEPIKAEYHHADEWTLNQRLFAAMIHDNPKDFVGQKAGEIGWERRPPAVRAAKAVKKELARIAKGEPPPDMQKVSLGLQIATMMMPRKAKRGR